MTDKDLNFGDLERIEKKLKDSLARRMGSIQEDRALNTSGRNVGNAESYVKEARTLRKILKMAGGQRYVRLGETITGPTEWVSDETVDALDLGGVTELNEVCEALHEAGNPLEQYDSMTDHSTVPGRPA